MSLTRIFRGKLRRKVVSFCLVSSLIFFIYVSLKLLTTHESDAIAFSSQRLAKRGVRSGGGGAGDDGFDVDENGDVIPPPLHQQLKLAASGSNKTDLNKVIVPYKVFSRMRMIRVCGCSWA